ncbi:unnamed protein product [Adineta ricciae]|nr:unnamed protein product [Adineta ricciae]
MLNIPSINVNTKWLHNGITVAEGNSQSNGFNQLNNPHGMCIDDNQVIYVADFRNHRIMERKKGAPSDRIVAGGNDAGNRND